MSAVVDIRGGKEGIDLASLGLLILTVKVL